MDNIQLARKQKRLLDWKKFLLTEVRDPEVAAQLKTALADYSNVIYTCWENSAISSENSQRIGDLERILEQLDEDARMRMARPHQPT